MEDLIKAAAMIGALLALSAQVAKAETFLVHGKNTTRLEAIRTLIREPGTEVLRCNLIELTDKATVRNVKKIVKGDIPVKK